MQLRITARHFDMNGNLKEFAEKNFAKLERYFENIVDCHLILTKDRYRQVAEGTLKVYGTVITAKVATNDMHASVEKLADKLEAQLKRYKDKLKTKDQKKLSQLKAEAGLPTGSQETPEDEE
ncbi:MAG: ribosome-associated translation inhibitor RaiA [candidate division Zixibacteria bacterium]|nr:ribosome-associated translation inhibitor RaiA [candidate division Zixibacteria bacterium]